MTPATGAHLGGPDTATSVSQPTSWLLTVALDDAASVRLTGGGLAARGDLQVFFEGLLFDREDWEARLRVEAGALTPAELVLTACERRGDRVLELLRGSFVLAVHDRARGRVSIQRDPIGSHPLFFARRGQEILFATLPGSLLRQPGISRELNREALADHLCHRWPDREETFFRAIRRVPPGWRAVISGRRLELVRYWRPIPDDGRIEWASASDAARFPEFFDRAVSRCLAKGRPGIFLSGGLDSIAVAAAASDAARRIGQPALQALSLAFPDPECDERETQTSVARRLGLAQQIVDFRDAIGPSGLFADVLQLSAGWAMPLLNPWLPAYLELAARGTRAGVDTILTGQGGDEWLTVSPFWAAELLRRGRLTATARFAMTLRRSHQLSPIRMGWNIFWTCGLRALLGQAASTLAPSLHERNRVRRQLRDYPAWVAPDRELRQAQRVRAAQGLCDPAPPEGFYLREVRTALDHSLISWDLEEQFQFGLRAGVRFAHPFVDADLVELLCRIPPPLLNDRGRTKGLVRRTLANRLPELGLGSQRKVSATPFYRGLLRREAPPLLERFGRFEALSRLGVVDGRGAGAWAREQFRENGVRFHRAWEPINLENWVRRELN